ncbi:MAG TPA: hypothetical protein VNO82_06775 [Solirubrobacteraceae bacterium]|jgi:hypothetical protein|nr:hypothetical protein [Solirubrobacteraceae bacterium]
MSEDLYRRWIHAREEDDGDLRVYRPADYDLPPARGRRAIEFRPDGELLVYAPGPADKPVASPGRIEDVEVVSVEPDRLTLRWHGG